MLGIDLNQLVTYNYASMRYFEMGEHHVYRFCKDNVLLMVYEGTLRFSEDGKQVEVHAGEYYIQEKKRYQGGEMQSDAPKYLYVHFDGVWCDLPDALPLRGTFDPVRLMELMERIDRAAHRRSPYCERQYLFLKLLLSLRVKTELTPAVQSICSYIDENLRDISSLTELCERFHYSKNYIIRIFNSALGISPIQYINEEKIKRAMYLLETTSKPIGEISAECGYSDYPYFYKRFMRAVGTSPFEWRKRVQHHPLVE